MPYRAESKWGWDLKICVLAIFVLFGLLGWALGDERHLRETGHHVSIGCCVRK